MDRKAAMSSTLIGLTTTAELAVGRHHLGQRVGGLGMAAGQRAVGPEPEQHEPRAQQPAADHVGREVAAEQDRGRAAPRSRGRPRRRTPAGAARGGARSISDSTISQSGERDDGRCVARRVGVGVVEPHRVLPLGSGPLEQALDGGGRHGGGDHDARHEDAGAQVALGPERQGDGGGVGRHRDRPEPDLHQAQQVRQPGDVVGPVLGVPPPGVERVERGAVPGHQEGQHGDQREADARPRQERGAGSVEHEGSMPPRAQRPSADRVSRVLPHGVGR